jgi:hypothetical protein
LFILLAKLEERCGEPYTYVLSWIVLDSSITFQNSYSFQCKEALFLTSKDKDWNLEVKNMNYVAMEETLSPLLYHQSQSHSE